MNPCDFAYALSLLRTGKRVARSGWNGIQNGKIQYLELQVPGLGSKMNHPYIYMTAGFGTGPYTLVPWVASQIDLLADDWIEIT